MTEHTCLPKRPCLILSVRFTTLRMIFETIWPFCKKSPGAFRIGLSKQSVPKFFLSATLA